jgi:hypothetical protein
MAKLRAPHVQIDPISFLVYGFSAALFISTAKLVALKFHGHPLAQATLLLL